MSIYIVNDRRNDDVSIILYQRDIDNVEANISSIRINDVAIH